MSAALKTALAANGLSCAEELLALGRKEALRRPMVGEKVWRDAEESVAVAPKSIKALRQQAGLTQKAMAESLGVAERTYQDWEGGKAAISEPAWRLMQIKVALLDQPDLGREVESAVGTLSINL